MILGLDISTSITGATILDEEGNIVSCESWDMRNKKFFKDIYDKGESIRLWLSGGSSAKSMAILQSFNGMVSWASFRMLGKKPIHISAHEARKVCGIKIPKGRKAKEVVIEFVLDNVEDFEVEYTKFGNPKPGETDRADSWVVAKAGWIKWREKNLKS